MAIYVFHNMELGKWRHKRAQGRGQHTERENCFGPVFFSRSCIQRTRTETPCWALKTKSSETQCRPSSNSPPAEGLCYRRWYKLPEGKVQAAMRAQKQSTLKGVSKGLLGKRNLSFRPIEPLTEGKDAYCIKIPTIPIHKKVNRRSSETWNYG